MLQLIREVHSRKMRIVFDGVFNHVGINCWAFQDLKQHQKESPYKDWFDVKSWRDSEYNSQFTYKSWWAIPELPTWKQNRKGLADGPREYVYAATRRWMDPNGDSDPEDGIDGWRLDVAYEIPHRFWKDWRKLVNDGAGFQIRRR